MLDAFFACFLLCRISVPNGVQTQRNFSKNFYGPEETTWAKEVLEGRPEGGTTHQGASRGPGAPRSVVPTSVASHTASSPYKYPNILETLGKTSKHNSSRRKFQNHEIQSRHHCRCQNRWISGRGSRTVHLRSMVIGDKGHDVYPGSGPPYGGNTLLPA